MNTLSSTLYQYKVLFTLTKDKPSRLTDAKRYKRYRQRKSKMETLTLTKKMKKKKEVCTGRNIHKNKGILS